MQFANSINNMADSRFARTSPLRSDRLKLNVFVSETGAYLTHWRYDGTPEPFSPLFVQLLEQQITLLLLVMDEAPSWLMNFPGLSNDLLGIAHVYEPGVGSSFWEVPLGSRGEYYVAPAQEPDYEAFRTFVRQTSGDRQRSRRAFTRLAYAQEHPEETVQLHHLVASRADEVPYDGDAESEAESEVAVQDLPLAPASWEVSLEDSESEPSTSSVRSYASHMVAEHAEDVRMHMSVASSTVDSEAAMEQEFNFGELDMDGSDSDNTSVFNGMDVNDGNDTSVFNDSQMSVAGGDWAADHTWASFSTHYSPTSSAEMEWLSPVNPNDGTIDLVSDSGTITLGSSSSESSSPPPPPSPTVLVSPMAASSPIVLPSPVPPVSPPSPALSSASSNMMAGSFSVSGICPLARPDTEPDQ